MDPDISPDEQEEKARLISQVLELQNTLDGNILLSVFLILIGSFFQFIKLCSECVFPQFNLYWLFNANEFCFYCCGKPHWID